MNISNSYQEIYVSMLSIFTLLGMGLSLTFEKISSTIRQYWISLIWGLVFNFLVIPFAALKTRNILNIEPAFFTGFFLCMSAPGGGTGSLLTYCAKGDISFSIALLLPLTLLSLAATPLWMIFACPININSSIWLAAMPMVTKLGLYIIAPLVLGLFIRKKWSSLADYIVKPVTRLSMVMLSILITGYIIIKWSQISVGGFSLIFLSLVSASAALAGGITAPHNDIRSALGFTSSIRNVTLAILLASTSYPDPKTMLAVLIYGLAQYIISFPAAVLMGRMIKE